MTKYYEIYISKKRDPSDKYGIHWAKVKLPDYDEEKAIAKCDLLRLVLGESFILSMIIKTVNN